MASKSKRNRQRRKRKEALLAAPDIAITVAVAEPTKEKKYGGGSIMNPPERETFNKGRVVVSLVEKLLGKQTTAAKKQLVDQEQNLRQLTKIAESDPRALDDLPEEDFIEVIGLLPQKIQAKFGLADEPLDNMAEKMLGIEPEEAAKNLELFNDIDEIVEYTNSLSTSDARKFMNSLSDEDKAIFSGELPDIQSTLTPREVRGNFAEGSLPTPMQIGQQKFNIQMKKEIKLYADLKALEKKYLQEKDEERLKNVRLDLENYKGSMAEDDYNIKLRRAAREQKAMGGEIPVDTYPNIPPEEMAEAEASQLPDMQMEEDYVDFVMNEALDQEEQMYLMNALEDDPQLSMIFDKVVDTASEFSGSGEVTGPGTGVSDSIPARLSDGEFVMTKKATDQIGADRLQTIMDEAERAYDGGLMRKDEETDLEGDMNKMMMSSNQMPSLNVRQR